MTRRELYLAAEGACVGALAVIAWWHGALLIALACFAIGTSLGHAWKGER